MIKESLIAAEERETKLNKLGEVLQILEKHDDFAALTAVIDSKHNQERGAVNTHLTASDKDWRDCSNVLSQLDFGTLMR